MRRVLTLTRLSAALAVFVVPACNSSDESANDDRPTVVVTTNILSDIVSAALGDLVGTEIDVEVIMPIGADPHEFAPSARQAEAMENADLLVVNGLGFEASMLDIIENVMATGTPVFPVTGRVDSLDGIDPHVWMDPVAMAAAFDTFDVVVANATGLGPGPVKRNVAAYVAELEALDRSIVETLADIPTSRRRLVTNHDSLGNFADAYGFEVTGSIIPSRSTSAQASAADLEDLAKLIEQLGVPAIFTETTESSRLADVLAREVGSNVEVVELYTGSLGPAGSGADSYIGMMTINAERIAVALG